MCNESILLFFAIIIPFFKIFLQVLFLICGQLLYAVSLTITKSSKTALLACLVFTINPASVFFASAYSEPLFMALTLSGLLVLYAHPNMPFIRHIGASIFFAFAFLTRLFYFLRQSSNLQIF